MRNQIISLLPLCIMFSLITVLPCNAQAYDAIPVDPRYGQDALPTEIQKVTLNLGVIHSMIIPESWDADKVVSTGVRKYVKAEYCNGQLAGSVSLEISTPVLISPQQAEQLSNAAEGKQLTNEQIYSLKNLPNTVIETSKPNDKTSATVLEIDGKKVLLIENSHEHKGPCIFLENGGSIMPQVNCLRGVAYVLANTNRLQTVSFNAEAWADISSYKDTIEKAIKSIEWAN